MLNLIYKSTRISTTDINSSKKQKAYCYLFSEILINNNRLFCFLLELMSVVEIRDLFSVNKK